MPRRHSKSRQPARPRSAPIRAPQPGEAPPPPAAVPASTAAAPPPRPAQRAAVAASPREDYSYVIHDLVRIGTVSSILVAGMLALSFALR